MKVRVQKKNEQKKSYNKSVITFCILLTLFVSGYSNAIVGADILTMIKVSISNAVTSIREEAAQAAKTIAEQTQKIASFTSTTVYNNNTTTNAVTDSVKVVTSQNSLSSQALAESQTKTSQVAAAAKQSIHMQDLLIKYMRKYSPSSQGFRACTTVADNKSLDASQTIANTNAANKETDTTDFISPSSSTYSAMTKNLKISQDNFCGVGNTSCQQSSLPGADVNAATLFSSSDVGTKEELAKKMYRQNLLAVNNSSLPNPQQAKTPNGQVAYYQGIHQAALLSPAAYSLAYIDANNTRSVNRDGKTLSPNELLDKEINKYYGGEDAKAWQASMLTQEPRGLLVEAARLSGFSTWMDFTTYKQDLRKEALLSSILITTAQPLTDSVRQKGNLAKAKVMVNTDSIYE